MHHLISRLQAEGIEVDEALQAEIGGLWVHGILRITNQNLKICLREYFCGIVPYQFFTSPQSASGKHHPIHHNRRCGIVRHITECCVLADKLIKSFGYIDETGEVRPEVRDIVLASTLVTDTFKNGRPWGEKTTPNHGEIAADLWRIVAHKFSISQDMLDQICYCVHWHYGRWTPSAEPRELRDLSSFAQIVHLLDTISSAEEIDVLFTPKQKLT